MHHPCREPGMHHPCREPGIPQGVRRVYTAGCEKGVYHCFTLLIRNMGSGRSLLRLFLTRFTVGFLLRTVRTGANPP